jgi:HME family heavy-metal exporter
MFKFIAKNPKTIIAALLLMSFAGVNAWRRLAVDIFPDIAIPRVTIMTEAGGFTAQEVEQLVTIPIESVVNGIPGVSCVRSSSSGGLSFVWVDFDWDVDISKARFDCRICH